MTTELDRVLRVLASVRRHLLIRGDEVPEKETRTQTRRKAATVARRLRRGLPAEPTEQELSRRKAEADDADGGGMDGFGKVEVEQNEPPFHEPWEGRVMAMNRAMGAAGAWFVAASCPNTPS